MDSNRLFVVVGGASGVGKTTVLNALGNHPRLNTGDFFKAAMKIGDRDGIKNGDWSAFEVDVVNSLIKASTELIANEKAVVIDTHFAAKVHGKRYRIGLRRDLINSLFESLLSFCAAKQINLKQLVILVYCDPYSLLNRRRADTSRQRELIPADCVLALRENNRCAPFYYHEASRAMIAAQNDCKYESNFRKVENTSLAEAQAQVKAAMGL